MPCPQTWLPDYRLIQPIQVYIKEFSCFHICELSPHPLLPYTHNKNSQTHALLQSYSILSLPFSECPCCVRKGMRRMCCAARSICSFPGGVCFTPHSNTHTHAHTHRIRCTVISKLHLLEPKPPNQINKQKKNRSDHAMTISWCRLPAVTKDSYWHAHCRSYFCLMSKSKVRW